MPLVVRTELLFPYVDGYNFVQQTYRQAGNHYAAIDDVLRNPPESTAQILHPDKYTNHVHPVDVQLVDVAAQLGDDWRGVRSGVLGELDTRVLLEQWHATHNEAARVASGWSGDRWQLVEKNGQAAIVVKSSGKPLPQPRTFSAPMRRACCALRRRDGRRVVRGAAGAHDTRRRD